MNYPYKHNYYSIVQIYPGRWGEKMMEVCRWIDFRQEKISGLESKFGKWWIVMALPHWMNLLRGNQMA